MQSDLVWAWNRPQSTKWFDDISTRSILINTLPGLVSCPTISRCVLGAGTLQGEPGAESLPLPPWGPRGRLPWWCLSFLLYHHYISLTSWVQGKSLWASPFWKSEIQPIVIAVCPKEQTQGLGACECWANLPRRDANILPFPLARSAKDTWKYP